MPKHSSPKLSESKYYTSKSSPSELRGPIFHENTTPRGKSRKHASIRKPDCLDHPQKYEWVVGEGCFDRETPLLPYVDGESTCIFCHTVFDTKQRVKSRTSYCSDKCEIKGKSVKPRFQRQIPDEAIHEYMKGVFESFIVDIEKANGIFGEKTFDGLYLDLKLHQSELTEEESQKLNDVIAAFEVQFGKFVGLVLNENKFMELSGSGKKPIVTPGDWAAAIRNLVRIVTLANQAFYSQLHAMTDPEKRQQYCKSLSAKRCTHPCQVQTTLGIKRCGYKS